ncbi:MAG TPA: hypothetical protein LFW21_02200 [Rickettsia endosymbiont of Pyrocoelia pectoralis]|nr:hypothetical protein [Rickettsia endosymbiont of Pyrocoelia pectoralis]
MYRYQYNHGETTSEPQNIRNNDQSIGEGETRLYQNPMTEEKEAELEKFVADNDQNREEDKMRLYQEEKEAELEEFVTDNDQNAEEDTTMASEQETEEFIADMQEKQNFINSINKYSKEYETIISTSDKAIIILGEEENLNIIANFLKEGELKVECNEFGDWDFSQKSIGGNLIDNFPVKNKIHLTYKSIYLNNHNVPAISAIDKFLLQQILSRISTKFILTVKTIETKNYSSPNTQTELKNLANKLKQFINLLENVDINKFNLSIAFTDTPENKTTTHLAKIINEAIHIGHFSEKQKAIISKIFIYSLPQASEQASNYKELLNITNNDKYIAPNKITVDGKNLEKFIDAIKSEININIGEFKKLIEKTWKEEKSSVFKAIEDNLSTNQTFFSASNKSKELINIIENCKTINNSNNTIGTFVEIVKELNQVLKISESGYKLETFLNYLKYISNVKFLEEEKLALVNTTEWFNDLLNNLVSMDIKQELLESFKHTILNDKYSFYNKLNEAITKDYIYIKNNNLLNNKAVSNIYNLQKFFEFIKNPNINIKNLHNIQAYLMKSLENLPNIDNALLMTVNKNISNSINSLKELIGAGISEQEAKSLWQYITESKFIKEISINFHKVISYKLLHNKILSDQEQHTYNLLEKFMIQSHESLVLQGQQELLYKIQLAKIYCQKAQLYTSNGSIDLSQDSIKQYEKAAKLGSIEANIKLGKMELYNGNYHKALEYFKNTNNLNYIKQAFGKLFELKESEIKNKAQEGDTADMVKSTLELATVCSDQVKIYKKYNLESLVKETLELIKITYLYAIAELEEIGSIKYYETLNYMYKQLASKISESPIQHKFLKAAEEYKNLALEFNRTQNLEDDFILADSVTEEETPPLIPYYDLVDNSDSNDNSLDLTEGHNWGSGESLDLILGNLSNYEVESSRSI